MMFCRLLLISTVCWSLVACQGASDAGIGEAEFQCPLNSSTIAISWTAPEENADNTVLDDLTGFIIFYGTASDAMTRSIVVPDPMATEYNVTGLCANRQYYLSMVAYNSQSVTSTLSNTINKLSTP